MFRFDLRRHRAGFTLIEILVVLVVIAILATFAYSTYVGKSGKSGEKSHGPIAESKVAVCTEDLHQVRMAIDMARQSDPDGKSPATLDELKLPHEMLICPDGKEPYQYDPNTGQVHCVHPGHENL
jgi:prepilin-type N-terminal cleavage/methylation domain-containing protein